MIERIINILRNSKSPLLQHISRSLERDSDFPLSYKLRKAFVFISSMLLSKWYLRHCNKVGRWVRTRGRPNIENSGRIEIGDFVNINSRNVRTDLITGPHGIIEIGNNVFTNIGVSIGSCSHVSIGDRVLIGPHTLIYDSDAHVLGERFKWAAGDPVFVEDDVWLAARVIVLKGSLIGKGSVISAGSVVSGIIPPDVVAGGIPAKVIKHIHSASEKKEGTEENDFIDSDVREKVFKVIEKLFALKGDDIDQEWGHADVEGWDSSGHQKLIKELEQEFGITISENDSIHMNKIHKIINRIQKLKNMKSRKSGFIHSTKKIYRNE